MPGYKLKDLKYTVVLPRGRSFRKGSGRGKAMDAAADGIKIFTNFLHNIGLKRNIDRKLNEMYPDIEKAIGNHTGILVVVQYQQSKASDPDFATPEMLSIMIGPEASNLPSAMRRWEQMCKIIPGPEKGKVAFENYLWLTKEKSKKEDPQKVKVLDSKNMP